jgi:class 3 adenylate cyclase
MSIPLTQLLPYLPPGLARAHLSAPADRRPTLPALEPLRAAVLFADVSGFTPLTEGLARRGAEGPEELTDLLNRYFGAMIALLEAEGGEVAKFSGDALTVLFPAGDEPLGQAMRRALQAAEGLQHGMAAFAVTQTSAGPINLALKIGVGAGEVRVFRVGGVFGRWEYVVAGDPLRQVAEAEKQARPGEIVLSPEAAALIWPAPLSGWPPSSPAISPPPCGPG